MKISVLLSSFVWNLILFTLVFKDYIMYPTLVAGILTLFYIIVLVYLVPRYSILIEYINLNPYLFAILILTPYTLIIILYLLNRDLGKLFKSVISLGLYNGVWFEKIIKNLIK